LAVRRPSWIKLGIQFPHHFRHTLKKWIKIPSCSRRPIGELIFRAESRNQLEPFLEKAIAFISFRQGNTLARDDSIAVHVHQ
jgi:hypothetical protein